MKKSSSKTGSKTVAKPPATRKSAKTASETAAKTKSAEPGATRSWTFLTNHSHVLIVLHQQPDMVLREVATAVGITERAVQRIVQDLEQGGFVRRERVGRCNHYEVITDMPLRHPIESHRNIGALLGIVDD